MGSRKRSHSEAVAAPKQQPVDDMGLLSRIRNFWQFACLMQYIAIFGKVMKIDEEFGIEDLEDECLKPEHSYKLLDIGLCLLKWISSHRGLTFDNFDEYTRRQYNAKAPNEPNPFGYDEVPLHFLDFDVFLKLRVLHQLSVWTFWNPDRIRDKMPEKKEGDQIQWRIEEFGWDREGRSYFVLDDNRLYRRTDPPIPAPQRTKKKPKSRSSRVSRTSKRASAAAVENGSGEENEDANGANGSHFDFKWECVAVTLPEYQDFVDSIRKSKDADEKTLRSRLEEHVLPILEKAEEAQQRKRQKREKELLNMQMLAGAKRSSRLAAKEEKERSERDAAEASRKHEAALAEARREQARKQQLEQDRQSRMMTREQRIKDREQKRILHQEEMERIKEEEARLERGEGRISARNLKAEREKMQKNMDDLQEESWVFDCSGCGVYGENIDDGSHSVACERCNVWQHSACLGIIRDDAEKDDFHFVCQDCKRKEEEANKPKIPPLKFRVSTSASPSSVPPSSVPPSSVPPSSSIPSPAFVPLPASVPPPSSIPPPPSAPPSDHKRKAEEDVSPPSPTKRPRNGLESPSTHNGTPGLSPTKHDSPRPSTSGGLASTPVLPPFHKLDPSPNLMGRRSPDAPIPPPVKCMTPEQEERRRKEGTSTLFQGHTYPYNGQAYPMSSPSSIHQIPPLGPVAASPLPDPVPSPQHHTYNGQTQPLSSPSITRIPPLGPAASSPLPDPVPSPQHQPFSGQGRHPPSSPPRNARQE